MIWAFHTEYGGRENLVIVDEVDFCVLKKKLAKILGLKLLQNISIQIKKHKISKEITFSLFSPV